MTLDFTDAWCSNWSDHLTDLFQQRRDNDYVHLLVDTAFLPHWHKRIDTGRAWCALFDDQSGDSELLSVSPVVLTFTPDDDRLLSALGALSGAPALSAVVTPEPLAAWARRLAPWCVVAIDGQWFNCRFPDTRRLPGIWAALSQSQRMSLAGPATSWAYVDRDGSWQTLHALPMAESQPMDEVNLTTEQFACILADAEVDTLLFRCLTRGRHQQFTHAQRYAHAALALDVAQSVGLPEPDHRSWVDHWLSERGDALANEATRELAQTTLCQWMQHKKVTE